MVTATLVRLVLHSVLVILVKSVFQLPQVINGLMLELVGMVVIPREPAVVITIINIMKMAKNAVTTVLMVTAIFIPVMLQLVLGQVPKLVLVIMVAWEVTLLKAARLLTVIVVNPIPNDVLAMQLKLVVMLAQGIIGRRIKLVLMVVIATSIATVVLLLKIIAIINKSVMVIHN